MEQYNRDIKTFALPNGFQVVTEYIPFFPSVSFGFWVRAGSVYETRETNGFSHFIEHMLFKSTTTRSTLDIAAEIDCLGGQVNAFTSKECTAFYAKVISEHLDRALDLVGDLILHPRFDPEEFEKERGVVLEEIAMSEDSPDDLTMDLIAEAWYGEHPLAYTILGPEQQIATITRDELVSFYEKYYRPNNVVLSVAGQFDFDKLKETCERLFWNWEPSDEKIEIPVLASFEPKALIRRKDIEQVHIAQAWKGVGQSDLRMYPLSVLCNAIGGGNASRLFQKIREEMGAAYTVFCYPSVYTKNGEVILYAGTSQENAQKVSHAIHEEIKKLRDHGITEDEFHMAKEQLKVSYLLGMESASSRMMAIGKSYLTRGKVVDTREVLEKMNAVTLEATNEEIEKIFTGPYAAAAVGQTVADIYL